MTDAAPFTLHAAVDAAERPGIIAAAKFLSASLAQASGRPSWPIRVSITAPGMDPEAEPPGPFVASLLSEAGRVEETIDATDNRWRAYLAGLQRRASTILLCTVFRHVDDRSRDGRISPLAERIGRLNRLAIDLSNELGVGVIDIDRAFSYIGAQALETDYRLGGAAAENAMGHTVALGLLSYDIDEWVDPAVQEKAKMLLGNLDHVAMQVNLAAAKRRATAAAS